MRLRIITISDEILTKCNQHQPQITASLSPHFEKGHPKSAFSISSACQAIWLRNALHIASTIGAGYCCAASGLLRPCSLPSILWWQCEPSQNRPFKALKTQSLFVSTFVRFLIGTPLGETSPSTHWSKCAIWTLRLPMMLSTLLVQKEIGPLQNSALALKELKNWTAYWRIEVKVSEARSQARDPEGCSKAKKLPIFIWNPASHMEKSMWFKASFKLMFLRALFTMRFQLECMSWHTNVQGGESIRAFGWNIMTSCSKSL